MRIRTLAILGLLILGACKPVQPATGMRPPAPTLAPATPTATENIPLRSMENPTPLALAPSPTPVQDLRNFQLISALDTVLPGIITNLQVTGDGSIWLASDRGVARLYAGIHQADLARFWDLAVGADETGRFWVVSRNGAQISSWDGSSWTHYDEKRGWLPIPNHPEFPRVQTGIQTDSSGTIWLATSWDIRRFNGREWIVSTPSTMNLPLPWKKNQVTSLHLLVIPGTEQVWVGGCDWQNGEVVGGGGIRRFVDGTWQDARLPVSPACVTSLTMGSPGNLWAGVNGSLWHFNLASETWTEYPPPPLPSPSSELEYQAILDLPADDLNHLFPRFSLCGQAGCDLHTIRFFFMDGLWKPLDGIQPAGQESIQFDASRTPWKITPNQLSRFWENQWEEFAQLEIQAHALDSQGKLWLAAGFNQRLSLWAQNPE